MNCEHFGKCGSCTLYEMDYETQLNFKVDKIKKLFDIDKFDVLTSKPAHFRSRAEFRIYHDYEKNTLSYAMFEKGKKRVLPIKECSIVNETIAKMMQPILDALREVEILHHRLFSIEFLSGDNDELLVTLIYHKKIDSLWEDEAKKIAKMLKIDLIGRSRGIKKIVTKDFVTRNLNIFDHTYTFKLYESGFSQPNNFVNQKMIEWVKKEVEKTHRDLLELYCGHGNFTIALAENFRKVLATEISKSSIKAAKENTFLNDVTNISFIRLSAQELTQAIAKTRIFKRLINIDLDSYDISHIFVDPPRAGLDELTIKLIQNYENIIYISCNPITLKRDLDILKKSFAIRSFAIFDQFAYTEHIECGVFLKKL